MHHAAGALELSTAGGVIAQTGALQTLFVLLVALLAGLLVLLDQLEIPHPDLLQLKRLDGLGEVLVEVFILVRALEALEVDHSRAVGQLLYLTQVLRQFEINFGATLGVLFDTVDEPVEIWVNWKLCSHGLPLAFV